MTVSHLSLPEIYDIALNALCHAGANNDNAAAGARVVTNAERDGAHAHGLFRIPGYVAGLKSGKVNGDANPQPQSSTTNIIRYDG